MGNCIISENANLVDELVKSSQKVTIIASHSKVCDSKMNCRSEFNNKITGLNILHYRDSAGNTWNKSTNKQGNGTITTSDGKVTKRIEVKGRLSARDNFKMNAKISEMGSFGFNTADVLF